MITSSIYFMKLLIDLKLFRNTQNTICKSIWRKVEMYKEKIAYEELKQENITKKIIKKELLVKKSRKK